MAQSTDTVKLRIQTRIDSLTQSERQAAIVLLQDYPVQGLGSITTLAAAAGVSSPTILRMARKLGFDGFAAMQDALRAELAAQIKLPISKGSWPPDHDHSHILARFAEAVAANIASVLQQTEPALFDKTAALLADQSKQISIVGGRITRPNADYLYNHLQIIRPGVTLLAPSANVWPQFLLDSGPSSILVLFDIRRYESDLFKLANLFTQRGGALVLFTDIWGSPITKLADLAFHAPIEAPSSWDSTIALMVLIEALIAQVQSNCGDQSRERITELESMFVHTKLFRDFT
ncbi:MAG: MurR/RpiR family transcriptional regulator [Rhodobacteraceae bacterium]|nr:MurR/RpiR family transcriptional regulator [Paracoccaceae bacterium]